MVLGIFKIALRLRGQHVFMWQTVKVSNVFSSLIRNHWSLSLIHCTILIAKQLFELGAGIECSFSRDWQEWWNRRQTIFFPGTGKLGFSHNISQKATSYLLVCCEGFNKCLEAEYLTIMCKWKQIHYK